MTLETDIEQKVVRFARSLNCLAFKLTSLGQIGWPDYLFLYRGQVLFVEFKIPGKQPRALQKYRMYKLMEHGFNAIWVDSEAEGKSAIRAFTSQS